MYRVSTHKLIKHLFFTQIGFHRHKKFKSKKSNATIYVGQPVRRLPKRKRDPSRHRRRTGRAVLQPEEPEVGDDGEYPVLPWRPTRPHGTHPCNVVEHVG